MSIPLRHEVPEADTWDLSALYPNWDAWELDLQRLHSYLEELSRYQGRLGESLEVLKEALDWSQQLSQLMERLGHYVGLRVTEDLSQQEVLERQGRYENLSVQIDAGLSWWNPELLSIDDERFESWIKSPLLDDYHVSLQKSRRFKPHILSPEAERVLALGAQAEEAVNEAFESLTNVDLKFGTISSPQGERPLTQSTFILFLQDPNRAIRLKAYDQFYAEFRDHAHTLATLYAGSVYRDVFHARARNFGSSLEQALFPDKVPPTVYENLIATVRSSLTVLHRYYEIRRRALGLERLHHADMYAPMVKDVVVRHSWEQAVDTISQALKPLGREYVDVLRRGLTLERWCDRYENKGKRSGAFSSGGWFGNPYILMNYHDENLRDVFTLAHEAGHSMHSWYSVRSNPYSCYHYTIFEAEVASTFNEQLLAHHFLATTSDPSVRAAILGKQIEDFVATFFRQTMFAEFEWKVHQHAEAGGGLTLEYFTQTYQELLNAYFGPNVEFTQNSALECLRIPHFYRAFYVYKYATGIAAALALAQRVREGSEAERQDYENFLRSGGSRYPLESLKLGGVDMARPEPIQKALAVFGEQLDSFEQLLGQLG